MYWTLIITLIAATQSICPYCSYGYCQDSYGIQSCSRCDVGTLLQVELNITQLNLSPYYHYTIGICMTCSPNCSKCYFGKINYDNLAPIGLPCSTCNDRFTINPKNYYFCLPCPDNCLVCTTGGANRVICTTCDFGYDFEGAQRCNKINTTILSQAVSSENQQSSKQTKLYGVEIIIGLGIFSFLVTVTAIILLIKCKQLRMDSAKAKYEQKSTQKIVEV